MLKGALWFSKAAWTQAEKKYQHLWSGSDMTYTDFRHTCFLLKSMGLPPSLHYSRIDFIHNAWLTSERKRRSEAEVTEEFRDSHSEEQIQQKQERLDRTKEHNATLTRGCIFCGINGKDKISHYSAHNELQCEEISRRALFLNLIQEGESLTLSRLMGHHDRAHAETFRAWAVFLYSLWKQLVWANKHGLTHVNLIEEQKQVRWTAAHNAVRSSTRKKFYYLRKRQIKAALHREKAMNKFKVQGHDRLRAKQAELIIWSVSRFEVGDLEGLTKEATELGCQVGLSATEPH
jgi:hypothetical protein